MAVIRNLEGDVNRQEKPTKVAEKGKKRVLEKGKCSEKRSCVLTRLLTVRKVKPDSRFTNVNHKICMNLTKKIRFLVISPQFSTRIFPNKFSVWCKGKIEGYRWKIKFISGTVAPSLCPKMDSCQEQKQGDRKPVSGAAEKANTEGKVLHKHRISTSALQKKPLGNFHLITSSLKHMRSVLSHHTRNNLHLLVFSDTTWLTMTSAPERNNSPLLIPAGETALASSSAPAFLSNWGSSDLFNVGVIVWERRSYPVDVLGPGFGCKHGQDPRPASHVQHDFVLEDVLVVVHGVPVGQRPHLILQHLLVDHIEKIRKTCGCWARIPFSSEVQHLKSQEALQHQRVCTSLLSLQKWANVQKWLK